MTAPMPFRLARAAAFAAVCTGLGIAAHALGAGTPPTRSIMLGLLLSFMAALPALGRERSMSVLLPLLGGLQVALHLLFGLTHEVVPAVPVAADAPANMAGHAHALLPADLNMLVLHGCAVALTALWLSWGEALLWAALRQAAMRFVRVVLAWVLPEPVPQVALPFEEPRSPLSAVLRNAVSLRGPPLPI
jgi:hypothetical protein